MIRKIKEGRIAGDLLTHTLNRKDQNQEVLNLANLFSPFSYHFIFGNEQNPQVLKGTTAGVWVSGKRTVHEEDFYYEAADADGAV